jgi:hypothetical protein
MRALAVLMMVQGHTIDTFLADQFRTYDSTPYNVWLTIRGFTAPIFMFTSGVVFTYLLKLNTKPFFENPRVLKGFKRFLTLVVIGYLLRFPTPRVFDFSLVTRDQWLTFFAVDALHLIGFGLFFILCLVFLSERFKVNDYFIFSIGFFFFLLMYPFADKINWSNILPLPFAAYMYQGNGSLFPFFPWASYVIAGGMLGSYLAKNPEVYKSSKFSYRLFMLSGIMIIASVAANQIDERILGGTREFFTDGFSLVFYRISIVLLLNGIMAFLSVRLNNIPEIIKNVGKHTLLIYAVHVVILYGSAWIPGFGMFYPRTLNIAGPILAALVLIMLMIGMVALLEFLKLYRKRKFATAEI